MVTFQSANFKGPAIPKLKSITETVRQTDFRIGLENEPGSISGVIVSLRLLFSTIFVRESILEVSKTLYEARILVGIVIIVFRQDWRSNLVPATTIPVTIIAFGIVAYDEILICPRRNGWAEFGPTPSAFLSDRDLAILGFEMRGGFRRGVQSVSL